MLKNVFDSAFDPFIESREAFKDLFDHAHDLIHILKPDGSILYVNNSWSKALGYSVEEVKEKLIYDLVDAKDREKFILYRNEILSGKPLKVITIALTGKNGNIIFVEGFVTAKMQDGIALYTTGIFRDITLRLHSEEILKQTNDRLKEKEENLSSLIENAPDAVIVVDEASNIILWNPKSEEIFEWTADEVLGTPLADKIIPPIYREAHEKGMKRYLATGVAHVINKTIEILAINKSGKEFPISLTISKSVTANKISFISFIRDISKQKEYEQELKQKEKELEASNKEIEQYAWLTSHDLREPLRKILIYNDIVLSQHQQELTPKVGEFLQKTSDAAKRMSMFIEALLQYSSVAEEKAFEQTDLNKIIKDVLADLELMIQESNALVEVDDFPLIKAIPFQMQQLFQNLISNAIKYKRQDIQPIIQVKLLMKDNKFIQLAIKDNGIGIDEEDQKKVFRLFQRTKTSKAVAGSGVGLAISKKIIDKHKGTITLESVPLIGTSFIISLPTNI